LGIGKTDIFQLLGDQALGIGAGDALDLTTKQQYRPEYDIYSFGLVLLEIGLWRTIDTIWKQSPSDAAFRVLVRTEYCDRLLGKMGEVY